MAISGPGTTTSARAARDRPSAAAATGLASRLEPSWAWPAIVLLVALAPILSGLRRGLPIPGFRLSELLTVALAGAVLVAARRGSLRGLTRLDLLALAYVAATLGLGAIDLLRRDAPFDSDNVSGLVGPIQYLLLFRAVSITAVTEDRREALVRVLLLASVPVAVLAILQGFGVDTVVRWGVDLTGSDYRGVFADQGFVRATGLFPHWQVAAGYFMVVSLLAVAALVRRGHRIAPDALLVAVVVLDGVALLRTVTTGASSAFAVGGVLLAVTAGRLRSARTIVATVLLIVLVLAGSVFAPRFREQYQPTARGPQAEGVLPRTVAYRLDVWRDQYLPVLEDRWLMGYGPDIPPNARWKYTESVYVTMLLRGGVLLLAAYLALMAWLAVLGRRLVRDGPPVDAALGAATITIVLVLAVTQIIATYFTTSGTPQVVWILAGLVAAATAVRGAGREPTIVEGR